MTETRNKPQGKKPKTLKNMELNSMLLNNERIKHEIREEIKKFLETNENELTIIQNLWDTAKAVLRGTFIAIQAYLKKIETFQINNLPYTYKNSSNNNKDSPEQVKGRI